MKLFVWKEFCPDYLDGLAVVIAKDIDGAKTELENTCSYNPSGWGPVQIFDLKELSKPLAFAVGGSS